MANSVINDATTGRKAESCGACRYADDAGWRMLYCRRFPAVPDSNGRGKFPIISPTDWCGEYARG